MDGNNRNHIVLCDLVALPKLQIEMLSFVDINGARLTCRISSNDTNKPLFMTLHGGRGFGECVEHDIDRGS